MPSLGFCPPSFLAFRNSSFRELSPWGLQLHSHTVTQLHSYTVTPLPPSAMAATANPNTVLEDMLLRTLAAHQSETPTLAAKLLNQTVLFAQGEIVLGLGSSSALALHNLLAEMAHEIDPGAAEGLYSQFAAMVETTYGESGHIKSHTLHINESIVYIVHTCAFIYISLAHPPHHPQAHPPSPPPTVSPPSPPSSPPNASSSSPSSTPAALSSSASATSARSTSVRPTRTLT